MSALDQFIDSLLAASAEQRPYAVGTVETVTPTVTVKSNGAVITPRVPVGYSLTVGQTVLIARFGPQRLILHAY